MAKRKFFGDLKFSKDLIISFFGDKSIHSFKTIQGFELSRTKNINLFLLKGWKCDVCGVEVDHFRIIRENNLIPKKKQKELGKNHTTYSLIPINTNGTEMTRDHITPKCMDGGNEVSNLVPMCKRCNGIWKSQFDKMEKIEASIINLTMEDFIGED